MPKILSLIIGAFILFPIGRAEAVLVSGGSDSTESQIISEKQETKKVVSKKRPSSRGTLSISAKPRKRAGTVPTPQRIEERRTLGRPTSKHPLAADPEIRTVRSKNQPQNRVQLRGKAYGSGGTISGGSGRVQLSGSASGNRRIVESQ